MSDFYHSRFRAVYYYDEGTAQVVWPLAEYGDLLSGEPTREWSAETASHSLVGAVWGLDEPAGNAQLDTVKESIRKQLLMEAQDEEWMALVDAWKNDGSVKLEHDLIHSLEYQPVAVG